MQTQCPNCNHEFNVKRSPNGAGYVKDWITLPEQNTKLLAWWLSNYPKQPIDKERIVFESKLVSIDSVNARVSELYGCHLVKKIHDNSYLLNYERAVSVLNNEGFLNC